MSHKRCSKCGITKELSEFSPHPKTRDRKQSNCRECRRIMSERLKRSKGIIPREEWLNKVRKPIKVKYEYNKKRNKERKYLAARKRKLLFIKMLGEKCSRCGIKLSIMWPISCFEFHHINGNGFKEGNISSLICGSLNKALIEIKKCQLVCANCHRAIHYPATEADSLK